MTSSYYVPASSKWPIFGVAVLGLLAIGIASSLAYQQGLPLIIAGLLGVFALLFFWFRDVIRESHAGVYNEQMDRSFRQGMGWFIFSEFMFFAAFFGTLFYVRMFALPWLDGDGAKGVTALLWPEFTASWPLMNPPDATISGPKEIIDPWHLPLINTVLLVASSITLTFSHHALKDEKRRHSILWLVATLVLGYTFLVVQGLEYIEAYTQLGLTLDAGIYGGTFFLLTGFHGFHVTIGVIALTVITMRLIKGHFSKNQQFGFEASAWYWHFVDVIWIGLFIFVYVV